MGVNGNPRVRVTAVIGDTSKNVHGRPSARPKGSEEVETKRKPRRNARLSRGGLRMS
jgi:hypothetical protein